MITFRRNITKSRSGHYHLTLIDKVTKLKVTGEYGWSTPEQAKREEEPKLVIALAAAVARRASLSQDFHKIAVAVAAVN